MPPTAPSVLFADVSGSTRLYDTLGDARAKALIDGCLGILREIVDRHGGRVVKTIGDELMCVLPDADRGHLAAADMQVAITALPEVAGLRRAIRVGFHAGPLIEEDDDVFGDTVNVAARMVALAGPKQILTTRGTVDQLSPAFREATRDIAGLPVKGKSGEVDVCEVLWQAGEDLTVITSPALAGAKPARLHLRHGPRTLMLEPGRTSLVVGRDTSCDIVLTDRMASRVHARIERRRDKFFLVDQSTNGTFVTFMGEAEIVLRRDEALLLGRGRIAFGHSLTESEADAVDFVVSD